MKAGAKPKLLVSCLLVIAVIIAVFIAIFGNEKDRDSASAWDATRGKNQTLSSSRQSRAIPKRPDKKPGQPDMPKYFRMVAAKPYVSADLLRKYLDEQGWRPESVVAAWFLNEDKGFRRELSERVNSSADPAYALFRAMKGGALKEAVSSSQQLAKANPNDALGWFMASDLLGKQGRWGEARDSLASGLNATGYAAGLSALSEEWLQIQRASGVTDLELAFKEQKDPFRAKGREILKNAILLGLSESDSLSPDQADRMLAITSRDSTSPTANRFIGDQVEKMDLQQLLLARLPEDAVLASGKTVGEETKSISIRKRRMDELLREAGMELLKCDDGTNEDFYRFRSLHGEAAAVEWLMGKKVPQ